MYLPKQNIPAINWQFYNAADISENQMQRLAKEMNYSETTFVVLKDIRVGGYNVRIYARTRITIRWSSYLELYTATRNHQPTS